MNRKKTFCILVALALAVILLAGCASTSKSKDLRIHFFTSDVVSWGDCTFIEFPNGETMLIDCGMQESGVEFSKFFKEQGISEIDYLVITHYHSDHVKGLLELLPSVKFKYAYSSGYCPTDFRWVDQELMRKGTQMIYVKAGDDFSVGDVTFNVLWPTAEYISEKPGASDSPSGRGSVIDLNCHSLVLRMTYGQNTVLFTGDLYVEAENEVLEYYKDNLWLLDCDVLKVMHHGYNTSSSDAFIKAVSPKYAFSMGTQTMDNNIYLRYYLVGCETYMSWYNGNAYVALDGENITVTLDKPEINPFYTKYIDGWLKLQELKNQN